MRVACSSAVREPVEKSTATRMVLSVFMGLVRFN